MGRPGRPKQEDDERSGYEQEAKKDPLWAKTVASVLKRLDKIEKSRPSRSPGGGPYCERNKALPEYHKIGRLVEQLARHSLTFAPAPKSGKPRARLHINVFDMLADDVGCAEDVLRKASLFRRRYGLQEARAAAKLGISFTHLASLLAVDDKELRGTLEQEAPDGRWSVQRLRAEIRRRYTPGFADRRRFSSPGDRTLQKIAGTSEDLAARLKKLAAAKAEDEDVQKMQKALGNELRKVVKAARKILP